MNRVVVVILSVMIAGCGMIDRIRGKDDQLEPLQPNPLPEVVEEVSVERAWSFDLGGGRSASLRPVLGASAVFAANPEGRVAALDVESGSVLWRTELDMMISGGVGLGEGLVMVGGLDGEVAALDVRDGTDVWQTTVGSEVMAPPRAAAGVAVVRTIDGGVTGLSTTTGGEQWKLQRDEPSLTLRGSSPPLIDQGVAVLGFADGKMAAVEMANGATLWEVSVSRPSGTNEVERMIDVDAAPMLRGNVLYAVSFQGSITAYALGSNQTVWSREISSYTDLAVDAENLYISDSTGRVHALDRSTGDEKWVQDELLRRRLSGPAVAGNYVVVGDYAGYLHVMDKSDGRLLGRRGFDGQIAAQPLVRDDAIFVLTENGELSSVSIAADGG